MTIPVAIRSLPVPVRRAGYRLAYAGLQVWFFVGRPRIEGVKCALTDGERVLLVRHTYGRRSWDLPGGTISRGEEPIETARREIREELGLEVTQWRSSGRLRVRISSSGDTIHCFTAEVHAPAIQIDLGELAAYAWFERSALPRDIGPFVIPLLRLAGVVR